MKLKAVHMVIISWKVHTLKLIFDSWGFIFLKFVVGRLNRNVGRIASRRNAGHGIMWDASLVNT